ncbi:MAG: hypothetical protein PVF58_05625 [Candidatus Methanofastidiosia archaeon]|jgi:hypothetical protein
MRQKIAFLLVLAVLLLGGAAVILGDITVSSMDMPAFNLGGSENGPPITPDGDDIPEGIPL